MIDPLLHQFFELLLPILETEGSTLTDAKYRFSISNCGLIILNYDYFLKDHLDVYNVKSYLKLSRGNLVKSIFGRCMTSFDGNGIYKSIEMESSFDRKFLCRNSSLRSFVYFFGR